MKSLGFTVSIMLTLFGLMALAAYLSIIMPEAYHAFSTASSAERPSLFFLILVLSAPPLITTGIGITGIYEAVKNTRA